METTTCPRCGRTDGTHVGYHEDAELPIKRGDRVRIKVGAEIWTTLPDPAKKRFALTRSRVVTVHSMDCGSSTWGGLDDVGEAIWQHVDDPGVCWVGTGGYWHHAKLVDVELVNRDAGGVAACPS